MNYVFRRMAVGMLLTMLLGPPVWAQSASSLGGTITDPSGAVVPAAKVKLTNQATGVVREATSGPDGSYVFAQLAPGTYRLEVGVQGFKTAFREVAVAVATGQTLDVQLEVGAVTETVEVEAAATALKSDASIGTAFSGTQVQNLPMLDRDPAGLLSLQAGVTFVPGTTFESGAISGDPDDDGRGGSVNGARSDQTNITLDGVDVNDAQYGYAFTSVLRSTLDSLQEFRVTTSNYNADLGRSGAAQVTLVTKSGSNDPHGSVYWQHRNEAFGANDFFLNSAGQEKPKLRRHIYGASLSGPVIKDRFFLFGNFERLEESLSRSELRSIPSANFRDGVLIYQCDDPGACPGNTALGISGATYTAAAGEYALSPAELAAIDPLGIGPNLAALAQFQQFPDQNDPGTFDRRNIVGFRFADPIKNDFKNFILRADFNLDTEGKHTVFWRGNYQDDSFKTSPQFPGQSPRQDTLSGNKGFAAAYTAVIKPTLVNTFRVGLTRVQEDRIGPLDRTFVDFRFIDDLGGLETAGTVNPSTGRAMPLWHIKDDLAWTTGNHTFTFGYDVRFLRNKTFRNTASFDDPTLNPSWLPNVGRNVTPGAATCEQAGCTAVPAVGNRSDFRDAVVNLMGIVTQYTAVYNLDRSGNLMPDGTILRREFATDEFEGYVQDQWRVTPGLTLTFGVRHVVTSPPWETNGLQVAPVPGLRNWFEERRRLMLAGLPTNDAPDLSFDFGGPENNGPNFYPWDWNNWSPRVAAAWSPSFTDGFLGRLFGDRRTVIRGGYALVYDRVGNGLVTTFNNAGSFGLSSQLTSTFAGCDEGAGTAPLGVCPRFTGVFDIAPIAAALRPPAPCPNGLPCTPPGVLSTGELALGGFAIDSSLSNDIRTPYAHTINVSLARELPGDITVEGVYVGRRGRKLLTQTDFAMPADIVDPGSGTSYFQAAQQLVALFSQGVDINSLGPIPFWENLFPSWGPAGINAGFLPCEVAPGSTSTGGFSATQVAYDWLNCLEGDGTVLPWAADIPGAILTLGGFPGFALGRPGDPDIDGDGLPDAPFTFFDDQYAALSAWSTFGRSEYHALQLMVRKRMSHGLQFGFNYTLSHALDLTSTPERQGTYGGNASAGGAQGYSGFIVNAWQPDLNYASADFDMRHQINTNWYVELPFGRGKPLGSGVAGALNHIIGGWQLSGLMRWNTGLPTGVLPDRVWATNWNLQGNGQCIPTGADQLGLAIGPCPSTQNVKNSSRGGPNLFADPSAGFDSFRFLAPGEAGNRNGLRADGYFTLDLGLGKSFDLGYAEGHRLVFRWDVFNVTNSVYFDALSLNNDLGSPSTFGDYTGISGAPRLMQFALRYEF